jgi:hypothetical protein
MKTLEFALSIGKWVVVNSDQSELDSQLAPIIEKQIEKV